MTKNPSAIKVLVVGPATSHGMAVSYVRAFKDLNCEVEILHTEDYYSITLLNRIINKLVKSRRFYGVGKLNDAVIKKITSFNPHFVFFMKPIYIKPSTVRSITQRGVGAFSWYPDDMFNPVSASRLFYESIPFYDCHVATKTFNVAEALDKGAKKAIFLPHAVDASIYHPVEVDEEKRRELGADVVFVGTGYEDDRIDKLEKLCQLGYDIKIYGNQWEKCSSRSCLKKRSRVINKPAYCEDYCKVMSSSKIALAFLSKLNRDLQTSRTYEIPACGIFMLHERSDEVMNLYKEGTEAEFFGTFQEMREKINYYLAHSEERKKIANAGYKRAIGHSFSYAARAEEVLKVYHELKRT